MKDNASLTLEMKLGLNLVKGAISVLNTDTAPQVILKNSIREIDLILKSGDEVLIDRCNGELSVKYRGVFESSGGILLFHLKCIRVYLLVRNGFF